jgi:hypothetical protein
VYVYQHFGAFTDLLDEAQAHNLIAKYADILKHAHLHRTLASFTPSWSQEKNRERTVCSHYSRISVRPQTPCSSALL